MSINSLANSAVARRVDFMPLGTVPKDLGEIANYSAILPATVAPPGRPDVQPQAEKKVDTALHLLFGYIPTEVVTLYVAVLAAIQQPGKITQAEWGTFWVFLIATPVIVWLVYGAKIKSAQKPLPLAPQSWPVWEMLAATVAYIAWAFALPNTPFADYPWYSSALSGLMVVIASTLLGLFAPLFQRPLNS